MTGLTPDEEEGLVARQDAFQVEAAELLVELDLMGRLGDATVIGSAALGLMVWRDLDIHVIVSALDPAHAFDALRPLLMDPRVTQVRYLNEATLADDRARLYFAVNLQTAGGADWKLDIGFWPAVRGPKEAAFAASMLARLTPESRLAILWIKDIWHRTPEYRTSVTSMDIYSAVLDHGVRTPIGFSAWLSDRRDDR